MKVAEAAATLRHIGLSRHEAAVFLNLARAGIATASELARASGVNRVQTYRALDSLEARGLVEVNLDRPKRYAARAIDQVIDMFTEEKRSELETLARIRKGLVEAWPEALRTGAADTSVRLQVIKGRAQIYRTIRRLVAEANREILSFTTSKGLQRSFREGINDILLERIPRGVKPRFLADLTPDNAALMARVAARVPLRHLDRQRGRLLVIDRESVLAFLVQDEQTIRGEGETALWTNSPDFVRAHVDLFEAAWSRAVPAKRRLAALHRPQG